MSRQKDALLEAATGHMKPFRDQDRFLPFANIGKVMRASLSKRAKISMESKECIQECVSEFISFITMEAAERSANEMRKTLTGDDVLFALSKLGFDEHASCMGTFLEKYKAQSAHLTDGFVADLGNGGNDLDSSNPMTEANDYLDTIESESKIQQTFDKLNKKPRRWSRESE